MRFVQLAENYFIYYYKKIYEKRKCKKKGKVGLENKKE